ncbi:MULTISPECIES: hypothetical protein [Streptomyces]|uniref:hypothetical protein n=1 Tax=Streptomyces TaxID=1883 RepID=UPI000AC8A07B|nr:MULTISPECIES: hypothetical protein [Streptomyces]
MDGLVQLYLTNRGNAGIELYARNEIDCLPQTTAEAAEPSPQRAALRRMLTSC